MTDTKLVHIQVSDSGWILEKIAKELAERLPYISYDLYPRSSAQIQYYITYGCRQARVSSIELAWYAHKEKAQTAAAKFEQTSREVDFCVCHSLATEKILRDDGIVHVETISPGVDLERFKIEVRIGVVGRTYHTGRKGESLIASVMDVPGISWHFTGKGWPGSSTHIAEEDMPAFYRSLDYVLVPSLIEGGPMCVPEALACGCKVIAAPIGWVPQFPHKEFKLGDAEDLRRVLMEVVEEKATLRRSVEGYTWDAFAQKHQALFKRLLGRDPLAEAQEAISVSLNGDIAKAKSALKAIIAVHGGETSTFLGGPSVRAPRTAVTLRRMGVEATFKPSRNFEASEADVVHVMNIWPPAECEAFMKQIEKNRRTIVFSPIFLDLSERLFFDAKSPGILDQAASDEEMKESFVALREEIKRRRVAPENEREPIPGYFSDVRRLTSHADHLILLSEHEKKILKEIGVDHPSTSIVRNPVDANVFSGGNPILFRERFGVADYVLCVGRIEGRKNQALLARVLRDKHIPLVLIGHESNLEYARLVRKMGGDNVIFAGRIDPGTSLLASAFAGARVFCLPSWSEGAPLAALEAAAAGCNMVLSNRSSEREYFGDFARYTEPADPEDLSAKIMAAYEEARSADNIQQQQQLVSTEFSWETYASRTADAYYQATACYEQRQKEAISIETTKPRTLFVDLTTLANHAGHPTGIIRVEDRIAYELKQLDPAAIQYVVWNAAYRKFIKVSGEDVVSGNIKELRGEAGLERLTNHHELTVFSEVNFTPGDALIVFGSAWMRNVPYLTALINLGRARAVSLIITVHDVIQHKFQAIYPASAAAEFSRHTKRILDISDMVLTCSRQSGKDVVELCVQNQIAVPPIRVFRHGDEASGIDPSIPLQEDVVQPFMNGRRFILYVSTIDIRKNHDLLLELWRRLVAEHDKSVPDLVLVGREGWGCELFMRKLRSDAPMQQKVHHLSDVNDATLKWLYQNCLFTVYPSLYEGWGIPVAESLCYGKFCIASNGGSLPEVAPEFAEYIDPLDIAAWYRALVKYIFSPTLLAARNEKAKEYRLTEWKDTAKTILAAVDECRTSPRLLPVLTDAIIDFRSDAPVGKFSASNFMLGGWSNRESNGTWTIGKKAVLGFQLDHRPTTPISFHFEAMGYCPDGIASKVNLVSNNSYLGQWLLGETPGFYSAKIAPSLFDFSGSLRIELHIANPRMPSAKGNSNDSRQLGIKIIVAALLTEKPQAATSPAEAEAAKAGSSKLEILLTMDDEAFVSTALRAIKGRQPHPNETKLPLAALKRGTDKVQLLVSLRAADDAKHLPPELKGLDEAVARNGALMARNNGKKPSNVTVELNRLLMLYDEAFVQGAYRTLLGREPDPEGKAYYLMRLRTGTVKPQILAEISCSDEAKKFNATVEGLEKIIRPFKRGTMRFMGFPFVGRMLLSSVDTPRSMRVLENKIHAIDTETQARFAKINDTLTSIHKLLQKNQPRPRNEKEA